MDFTQVHWFLLTPSSRLLALCRWLSRISPHGSLRDGRVQTAPKTFQMSTGTGIRRRADTCAKTAIWTIWRRRIRSWRYKIWSFTPRSRRRMMRFKDCRKPWRSWSSERRLQSTNWPDHGCGPFAVDALSNVVQSESSNHSWDGATPRWLDDCDSWIYIMLKNTSLGYLWEWEQSYGGSKF